MSHAVGASSSLLVGDLLPKDGALAADPALFVRKRSGASELHLVVFGARCAGCIAKIEGETRGVDGVSEARLNLSTGRLIVSWPGDSVDPKVIVERIGRLGYRAAPFDAETATDERDAEGRRLLIRLAVAGFAAANVMLLSVSVWSGAGEMGAATRALLHGISAALAAPAALYSGQVFFASAYAALRRGRANMDVPISLAVLLALGVSFVELFHNGVETYFDSAVMLVFFLLIGRYLDHRLRRRAGDAARRLLAMQTTTALKVSDNGVFTPIAARDIVAGDLLVLAPGDRAPVDGLIEKGASECDVSLVTGESAPKRLGMGDVIHAGVVNKSSRLTMRATAGVEGSLVADLARLVEAGGQARSRYVRLADRAAALYVPVVHSLALATFLGWLFFAHAGLRPSVLAAVSVLIITCPCALGLAAPVVQIVATSALFREGIFVKSGDALERLAEIDVVIFDKTGTLTRGAPALADAETAPPATLAAAALLARTSRHPLSRALADAAGPGPAVEDAVEHPGEGVEGHIDGVAARLGRASFVGAADAADDAMETWFRLGDAPPYRFIFRDPPRADAAETIRGLTKRGVATMLVTGDRRAAAAPVAAALGLTDWRAEASPHDKAALIERLKAEGRRVAMIGDGLNDTASLALAHVSFAPGTAADASQAASDFVYVGEKLAPVLRAVDVARGAKARSLENFAFAALYNVVASPVAMAGLASPLIAALAMSSSSIIVTLNALRLARTRKAAA